jgi:hypothetical protein
MPHNPEHLGADLRTTQRFSAGRQLAVGLAVCFAFLASLIQTKPASPSSQPFGGKGIPAKGFKIAEPYGPPYESQTKSLLEGGQALILPGGNAQLSEGVTLRTFSETNTPQLIVRARECFYNSTNHEVNSAGPIRMQTADSRFTIEGIGFYWRQTNSSLVISNDVHTAIQPDDSRTKSNQANSDPDAPETGPLFITSSRFAYDGATGRGVWRENVNVTGTNLLVNSQILTAEVLMDERQVHSLVAEQNVTLEYSGLHATGGRLNYAPNSGLIRLSDQAAWREIGQERRENHGIPAQQREGGGDELIVDRTNHVFQVNRHAWLKLPGQTLGESGFLSLSNAPAKNPTGPSKSIIEINCDSYEIRTNQAVFRDEVQLNEHLDNTVRGQLTCQAMTVTFAGTNELQTLTAEKDVVIQEDDKRFTGGRAFYTQINTTLEMTQNPAWRSGPRRGKGELLRLNTQQNEMLVRGKAYLALPATELAGQFSPVPGSAITNRPAGTGTNQVAEIFCEEYTLNPTNSIFLGGVYATHPEMNWSCERLNVRVQPGGPTNVVAQQNVVFDVMSQKGPVHGIGDDALYSFGTLKTLTNSLLVVDELRLNGAPAMLSGTNWTNHNPIIIWDRTKNKVILPGSEYKLQGVAKPMDTNIFVLPNKKRTK